MLEAMREDPRLEGFVAALTGQSDPEVDLSGVLAGATFTVLAPVAAVFEEDAATTSFLLSYHLVPGPDLSVEELLAQGSEGAGLQTLQGAALPVFTDQQDQGAPVVSEDTVPVLCEGVQTAGGALYVVAEQVAPAGDYAVPGGEPALPTTGAPSR